MSKSNGRGIFDKQLGDYMLQKGTILSEKYSGLGEKHAASNTNILEASSSAIPHL